MWTSRQQNEVLNIVQGKKYPHFEVSHFNAMSRDNICVICVKLAEGYNLLGAFESALC